MACLMDILVVYRAEGGSRSAPLSPAFDPAGKKYSAEIPAGIESVEVLGMPRWRWSAKDRKFVAPAVSVVGGSAIAPGDNLVRVIVTPAGAPAVVYTVTVTAPPGEEAAKSLLDEAVTDAEQAAILGRIFGGAALENEGLAAALVAQGGLSQNDVPMLLAQVRSYPVTEEKFYPVFRAWAAFQKNKMRFMNGGAPGGGVMGTMPF